ncbi:hypothetical protein EVAR_35382_1 [Eumeta japonica]|uniref:Uncharacterized protein n=1 Tax=Eumeta variegata TaxID=151549 RepID=A0A4C1XEH3_EUMVA|nr:hypothetical protein EVAR_35382_1 [Eumeta japonica]
MKSGFSSGKAPKVTDHHRFNFRLSYDIILQYRPSHHISTRRLADLPIFREMYTECMSLYEFSGSDGAATHHFAITPRDGRDGRG